MHNILMIIRREYRERVTKKSFWIGTLVFPVLMLGLVGSSIFFMSMQMAKQRHLAFIDATGAVAPPAAAKLSEGKLKDGSAMWVVEVVPVQGSVEETRKALTPRVLSKELYGVVTIGPDVDADDNFKFYGMNVSDIGATMEIRGALTDSVVALRLKKSQLAIDQEALEALTKRVDLETFQESAAGGATKKGFEQAFFATFGFVILMFMSLLLYGIAMLRGVLEEKTTRVMEVLLGSVSPNELMAGKILGIGLVGLTQMVIYMGTVGLLRVYILAKMGGGGFGWVQDALSPMKLIFFVVFFLLGYFFYTALFAAVGAVCNSEQEAQNLQQPLTMMLMIPYIMTFFFVRNSDHMAAVVMSLIPPFTPMIMFTRLSAGNVPAWQLALGLALLIGSTILVFRGAAKVFRIGILMYGKRPTIPEILRWARS
ncbi:MAG TPA: ABC transporter permease [Candidatus Polarisedimenticolaceae bacterium]|nr:ABC transporter permease [Candidatus Polarisedimenticolaceae bacterium]